MIHYHAVVRKALQYAVKNGLVNENVADRVDRPKKGKYLAAFYSKEELADLFEATKDDSISVVIQLAAYYGLRRSEVLGIRWSAIDFEKGTLSINHKVTEGIVDGKVRLYTEDKLKTKSSFRTLPLIPPVRVLLEEQCVRQQKYRKLFKKSYCTDYLDYVCTDEMGKLFRPNYITDHFKLLLKQHGLRHIRFHDLRHSCASLLLSQGIPMKQIQEWLGHSTFATTADIYSHLDFNSKLESADAITAAFAEEKPAEKQEEDGFGMSLTATVSTSAPLSHYTYGQTAVSYFPEFGYGTYWRLLERLTSGTTARFQFAKNIYSTYNQRVHFSPVWFPDGSYTVNTHVMDIWTPAGMLAMNLTDDVTISGSLYDDWHIAPGNP